MSIKLAIASRPNRFGDVIGQDHPVAYLSGLITRGKVGRNILLHGTVGSGKTTLALIFGQALLCHQPSSEDGSPCGTCKNCVQFEAGRLERETLGFFEYDVTGRGGYRRC